MKSETGFFRKSFNSFKRMRKSNRKRKNGVEEMTCEMCSHQEFNMASNETTATSKHRVTSKKKLQKFWFKSKENKENVLSEHFDNIWVLECGSESSSKSLEERPAISRCMPLERSFVRGCSSESCSSRTLDFREGSSFRDLDFTSFESASVGSYESDQSSTRFYRARSRIKTNPWLPSPQTSHSLGSPRRDYDLGESMEHVVMMQEQARGFARSVSFERRRQSNPYHSSNVGDFGPSRRFPRRNSPAQMDARMNLNFNSPFNSSPTRSGMDSWSIDCTPARQCNQAALNDLNSRNSRSRPASIISPNSEFTELADHLEKLANNISLEYDHMLDTTMDSVFTGTENCQGFVHHSLDTTMDSVFTGNENCQGFVHHSLNTTMDSVSVGDANELTFAEDKLDTTMESVPFGNEMSFQEPVHYNFNKTLESVFAVRENVLSFFEDKSEKEHVNKQEHQTDILQKHQTDILQEHHIDNLQPFQKHSLQELPAHNLKAFSIEYSKGQHNLHQLHTDCHQMIPDHNSQEILNHNAQEILNENTQELHADDASKAPHHLNHFDTQRTIHSSRAHRQKAQAIISKNKRKHEARYVSEGNSQASVHEPDNGRTAYKQNRVVATPVDEQPVSGEFSQENSAGRSAKVGRSSLGTSQAEEGFDMTSYISCRRILEFEQVMRNYDTVIVSGESAEIMTKDGFGNLMTVGGSAEIVTKDGSVKVIAACESGSFSNTDEPDNDRNRGVPATRHLRVTIPEIYEGITRLIPKTVALRTSPSCLEVQTKLNSVETESTLFVHAEQAGFVADFPRNITASEECLESPTDNWQWNGQYSSHDSILSPQFDWTTFPGSEDLHKATKFPGGDDLHEVTVEEDRQRILTEELVVKLEGKASTPKNTTEDEFSRSFSAMNCIWNKPLSRDYCPSSKTADACVQTDFDEDDATWDYLDILEDLDNDQLSHFQTSNFLPQGGTLQNSLHTSVCNPAKNGPIPIEECALCLAGQIKDRLQNERLYYEKSYHKSKECSLISQGPACSYTSSGNVPKHKVSSFLSESACEQNQVKQYYPKENLKLRSTQPTRKAPEITHSQLSLSRHFQNNRRAPENNVNLLFSEIEIQFQEIFKQLHGNNEMRVTMETKQSRPGDPVSNFTKLYSQKMDYETSETNKLAISENSNTVNCPSYDHNYTALSPPNCIYKNTSKPEFSEEYNDGINSSRCFGNSPHDRLKLEVNAQPVIPVSSSSKFMDYSSAIYAPVSTQGGSDDVDYRTFQRCVPFKESFARHQPVLELGRGPFGDTRVNTGVGPVGETHFRPIGGSLGYSFARPFSGGSLDNRLGTFSKTCQGVLVGHDDGTISDSLLEPSRETSSNCSVGPVGGTISDPLLEPSTSRETISNPRVGFANGVSSNPRVLQLHSSSKFASSSTISSTERSSLHPPSPARLSSTLTLTLPATLLTENPIPDNDRRCLAEKVKSLCQDKSLVFMKIRRAQLKEKSLQEQKMIIQRSMHAMRKDALLEILHELRADLEEQSRRLSQRKSVKMIGCSPFDVL